MEKMTMTDSTIAFIGLGLIGGSIARASEKHGRISVSWPICAPAPVWSKPGKRESWM